MYNKPHTEETKRKISLAKKGQKYPPRSEEHRRKISENNKNRKLSQETKIKISNSKKGQIPWNKGLEWIEIRGENNPSKRMDVREKIRQSKLGKNNPHYGKKTIHSMETRQKISISRLGSKNPGWIDGRSHEKYPSEFTVFLKKQIRQRDNHTCQKCFKTQEKELKEFNRKLAIHHIDYNKKNCENVNLITLCQLCNTKVNQNRNYWQFYFTNLIDLLDWT